MTAADAHAAPLSDSELAAIEQRHSWYVCCVCMNKHCQADCSKPERGHFNDYPCDSAKLLASHRAQAARLAVQTAALERIRDGCDMEWDPDRWQYTHMSLDTICRTATAALELRAGEPEGAGEGE